MNIRKSNDMEKELLEHISEVKNAILFKELVSVITKINESENIEQDIDNIVAQLIEIKDFVKKNI